MKILLILKLCLAGLRIWSPDPLTLLDIDNAVATFGDPFAFPRYGKLVPLYYSGDCSFSQIFETNTFAILYGFNHCYSSDLALSVQEFGGIGIIIVADDDNIDYIINPKDNFSSSLIKILVIAIKKSDGAAIFQYFPSQIWVTYSLVIEKIQASKSDFHMSSNYTLDKIFASAFQDISNQFSMSLNQFDITFCFLTPAAENIDSINDCLTSSSNTYCLPHTSTVTGSQKIYNSAAIINHYNTLSGSASEFFIFLTTLYSTCEFDYSISCIQTVLANFPNDQIINTSLTAFKTTSPLINSSPFYKFNGISYYWPDYIEKIYCLSLIVPPSDCKSCSPGCSYLDLLSSTCEENCNNDSCGYDMLTCVKFSSCYNFISGDGNCNSACSCDPDCGCGEDSCSIGCLYSIMNEGFCPLACTGDCFAYCSSDYCSPECSYLDMADGNCPENCSQNCKEKCGSEYCSPGCYYDDIASGLCPDNCKYECFSKCDSDYCSEECMYDDMDDQYCPDICAGRCCEAKINSGLPFYIWIVIVIVAVM